MKKSNKKIASHGDFHEDCVNIIMKDLIKLMNPKYIEVWGRFTPRGGISIDPYCNYGKPGTRWEQVFCCPHGWATPIIPPYKPYYSFLQKTLVKNNQAVYYYLVKFNRTVRLYHPVPKQNQD